MLPSRGLDRSPGLVSQLGMAPVPISVNLVGSVPI